MQLIIYLLGGDSPTETLTKWRRRTQKHSFPFSGSCGSPGQVICPHCLYTCCARPLWHQVLWLFIYLSVMVIRYFVPSLPSPSPRWQWLPNVSKSWVFPLLPIWHLSSFVPPASNSSKLNSIILDLHIILSVLKSTYTKNRSATVGIIFVTCRRDTLTPKWISLSGIRWS